MNTGQEHTSCTKRLSSVGRTRATRFSGPAATRTRTSRCSRCSSRFPKTQRCPSKRRVADSQQMQRRSRREAHRHREPSHTRRLTATCSERSLRARRRRRDELRDTRSNTGESLQPPTPTRTGSEDQMENEFNDTPFSHTYCIHIIHTWKLFQVL